MSASFSWPRDDFSRVPYAVFTDPDVYRAEQARVFRGPVWNYLGMTIEIPKAGDFLTTWIGDTHIIVTRARDGTIHAMENSCAHRGARIVDELRGNRLRLTCPYHLWTYDLTGNLASVPLEKGMNGRGGMPPCFDKKDHGLNRLRVTTYGGLVFGSYADEVADIETYLGPHAIAQINRLLVQRKPKVLGYLRQRIAGNWKLYNENVRDPYHGSLLHLFQVSFGIQTPTMRGGIKLDAEGKNTWNHSIMSVDDHTNEQALDREYQGTDKFAPKLKMADPRIVQVPLDLDDGVKTTIMSMFPSLILAQVDNTYALRHLRPKGPDLVELHITYLGFECDSAEDTFNKLLSANMIGPAGYISMEDGEALRLVQEGLRARTEQHSVVEMGGVGPIVDTDYLSQEISIRGFWKHYHRLLQP